MARGKSPSLPPPRKRATTPKAETKQMDCGCYRSRCQCTLSVTVAKDATVAPACGACEGGNHFFPSTEG